jgi:hypothetical protein
MKHTYKETRRIVRIMISILIHRGYHNPERLFHLTHDLYPGHGLHDAEVRRMIHAAKCW